MSDDVKLVKPRKKGRPQCVLCKQPILNDLKTCTETECDNPYYVHQECIKKGLVKKKLLTITCESCGTVDRYQKIESRPFYKYRWLAGLIFIFAVSFVPQIIARFSSPERVEKMGYVQLVLFSWIISFIFLMLLALFVILMTCIAKPLAFVRDTLMPPQVQYMHGGKAQ
jgi:hypothetical protein